ncbi:MAG: ABC transporter ATP-binding protein [Oscillospiraceae bacterium]|nr:ABC transporter ATP-binding protein [Oscillospiraceae bacterium]
MSLCAENLHYSYGDRPVLKGVSFTAEAGEFLSVLGPNGVGKSTLFRCILGLLTPTQGRTVIDGKDTSQMHPEELARRIAYIPQSHSPVFNYSVEDMVLMGTTSRVGRFAAPGKAQQAQAMDALERLGIADLASCGYQSISGGERQMVLIARALAQQAQILIMDEPSSSLDFGNRIRVMQTVKKLTGEGYTVIQSTHDPDQAFYYSDRILALQDGKVLAWGHPKEILCNSLISALYGTEVEVYSLRDDSVRICVPTDQHR